MDTSVAELQPPIKKDSQFTRRSRTIRFLGFVFILVALATSVGSFLVLTGQTAIQPSQTVFDYAKWLNLSVILALGIMIALEATALYRARRRRRAAARLHVRIVALFSFIAAFPAVLMAVLASVTLDRGLDRWFSERTKAIVDTSVSVANAYVLEHKARLGGDLLAVATEFNRAKPDIEKNQRIIADYLSNQARIYGLSAIRLVRRDGSVLVEGRTSTNNKVPPPPPNAFAQGNEGRPILIDPGTTNLVGGVVKLIGFEDLYLYFARPVDPRVTRHIRLSQEGSREFYQLQANRAGAQTAFAFLFTGMALVVLLSAIWLGLGFVDRLVSPIRRLIGAASEVSSGNLEVRVPVRESAGDIASLSSTFNTMIDQLRSQRNDLLNANEELDERRRFTEAVLSGVSAGVIGLEANGNITIANRSALELLGLGESDVVGKPITSVLPEIEHLLERRGRRNEVRRGQIQLTRDGELRILNVKITEESVGHIEDGLVVTLDEITDLMAAQRRSAWADVARRIAHEIKNPLTPIQLSAERIQRRYGRKIEEEDRGVFDQCTETIVRQVGDIRRMVDEFSAFARMPKPVMEMHDLNQIIKESVFLQEVGSPDIEYVLNLPEEPVMAHVDHRLVTQALTNIVKNASEAIEAVPVGELGKGRVEVSISENDSMILLDIEDNGKGLPKEQRESLLEPYMTTREKGTGLGLAIVRKIMEEHDGSIALLDAAGENAQGRGARIRLAFPKRDIETTVVGEDVETAKAV